MTTEPQKIAICVSYPLLSQGLRRMIEEDRSCVLVNPGCTSGGGCAIPQLLESQKPDVFVVEFGCEGYKYLLESGTEAPIIAVNVADNETYLHYTVKTSIESTQDLIGLVERALTRN